MASSASSSSSSPQTSSPSFTPCADATSTGMTGRLLIVANRLPVSMSIKQRQNTGNTSQQTSDISFTKSSGGLVSALAGTDMDSHWIGWPGGEVKQPQDRALVKQKLKDLKCIAVFLTTELCDLYYNGFCNDLLWPLFHYIPLPIDAIKQHDKQFKAYQRANAEFAKVVLENYEEGDAVWVHDYHLMLLPSLLRSARPSMRIGFFLHTPFPSSEIYRVIPSRAELLEGVLSSNLLGFHTHDYARHFQSAATRIVGAQCSNEQIKLHDMVVQIGTYPIGIDPIQFTKALTTEAVHKHLSDLRSQFQGRHVLLGIDRLDYIKGIPQKLHALELFFDRNPQWVGKVVLVQIAIPSRTDVVEYQRLKTSTHELVGRINGRFGSVSAVPIHYLDQSIPFDKMCAMYRLADALVITSIRDGMNLVAYEYIACQEGRNGVLILSEFAGAAQSLGAGALQVNPWNISEIADAILKSLTMTNNERQAMTDYSFNHVMSHTAKSWAREFVTELETIESQRFVSANSASHTNLSALPDAVITPVPLDVEVLCERFQYSRRRLIITGLANVFLHGTRLATATMQSSSDTPSDVVTMHKSSWDEHADEVFEMQGNSGDAQKKYTSDTSSAPSQIVSGRSRYQNYRRRPSGTMAALLGENSSMQHNLEEWMDMEPEHAVMDNKDENAAEPTVHELRDAILKLAADENTTYFILTSRTREWCDTLFADVAQMPPNLWLAAENGYFFKHGTSTSLSSAYEKDSINQHIGDSTASALSDGWRVMYENVSFSWMEGVNRVMTYFCERTPRSYIQAQETSMQWHYGDAEPIFAKRQALDLISHLTGGPLSNTATEVLDSANIVQVRPLAVSKGRALKHLLRATQIKSVRAGHVSGRPTDALIGQGDALVDEQLPNVPHRQFPIELDSNNAATPPDGQALPGLRSRRPSLADVESTSSIVEEEDRSVPTTNVTWPSSSCSSSSHGQDFDFDFVLCIGNFLDLDENIFALLNEWSDLGCLPPALQPNVHGSVTALSHSARAPVFAGNLQTPSSLYRRVSVGSGTNSFSHNSLSVNTTGVGNQQLQTVQSQASPVSIISPGLNSGADFASPSSEAGSEAYSAASGASSLIHPITSTPSIYTVSLDARSASKARFSLPDASYVSKVIIRLASIVSNEPKTSDLQKKNIDDNTLNDHLKEDA